MQTNCRTVVGRGILSAGQRKYQEKPGTSDSWQGREGWGLEEEKDAKATSRAGHEPASEMGKRIGAGGTWFTEDASFSALRQGGVVPSSGRWGGGRETAAQAAECPPNSFQKLEEQRSGAASWAGLGWAEAELGRRWAWRGRAGRRGLRAALGPAGRPAGSREVDKAAAAFDVSGELILNRYKMAEGDEAARRQQPHQGLRRRRRTSDPSVGVNHVSSTTSLGTGRRGAEAAGGGRGGRGGRAAARAWRSPGRPAGSGTQRPAGASVLPPPPPPPAGPKPPPRPALRRAAWEASARTAGGRTGGPAPCPPPLPPPPRGCRRVSPDPRGRPRAGAAARGRRGLAEVGAGGGGGGGGVGHPAAGTPLPSVPRAGPGREGSAGRAGPRGGGGGGGGGRGNRWHLAARSPSSPHTPDGSRSPQGQGCGGPRAPPVPELLEAARPIRGSCAWPGFQVLLA